MMNPKQEAMNCFAALEFEWTTKGLVNELAFFLHCRADQARDEGKENRAAHLTMAADAIAEAATKWLRSEDIGLGGAS